MHPHMPQMDLDDKVLHYLLVCLGMIVMTLGQRIADWIGLDIWHLLRRRKRTQSDGDQHEQRKSA